MFLGLIIDSKYVALNYFEHAQWINNILVLLLVVFLYKKSPPRSKALLINAIIIAVIGEYVFSKVFGMYAYRLGNIPHYIPLGHAVVFLFVYNFCKKQQVRAHKKILEQVLTVIIIFLSLTFLIFKSDVYGFILTILIFYFLRNYPKEKLFYLTMYVFVVYTENLGTALECWEYPLIAFDKFNFLPSANPPIGVSFFYFGLDRGTVSIYKRMHKEAWARLKRMRALNG